jgi:hypothetical protein
MQKRAVVTRGFYPMIGGEIGDRRDAIRSLAPKCVTRSIAGGRTFTACRGIDHVSLRASLVNVNGSRSINTLKLTTRNTWCLRRDVCRFTINQVLPTRLPFPIGGGLGEDCMWR